IAPLLTHDEATAPGPDALPFADGRYRKLAQAVLPDPAVAPVEYLAHAFSLPTWMAERWLTRFGWAECVRLGFWFAGPAPLTLRVNSLRTSRQDYLEKAGENVEVGQHPHAVRWRTHQPVTELPGYEEGLFVVQDETAMRAADALAPKPGERV